MLLRSDGVVEVTEGRGARKGCFAAGTRHGKASDRHFLWRRTGIVAAGPASGLARRQIAD